MDTPTRFANNIRINTLSPSRELNDSVTRLRSPASFNNYPKKDISSSTSGITTNSFQKVFIFFLLSIYNNFK